MKRSTKSNRSGLPSALSLGLVVVVLAVGASWAAATGHELAKKPGSNVILRKKNVSELVFTPPRDLGTGQPKVNTATFIVNYSGFTPQAQATFQAAVDVWSSLITSPVPIRVQANWTPLDPGILGNCGANYFWSFPSDPSVFYPDALADALNGSDVGGGGYDIVANFNSDNDDWYFGTDGNTPPYQTDFMTVVLHELGHGLGFIGSAWVEGGQGSIGQDGQMMIYDLFTEDVSGNVLINSYPNPSTALASVLQGGSLFWGGDNAVAANDGYRPQLYAPSVWDPGSSYSHLDEDLYPAGDPDSLMTPALGWGSAIHDPGAITLCLFQDIGWMTAETCGGGGGSTVLTSGVPVSGYVGVGEWDRYTITVPSGATSLVVATSDTAADIDLYLRYGAAPTLNDWDYRPYTTSGDETITVTPSSSPQPLVAGTWHVGVHGYQASPYSLVATVTGGGGGGSCTDDLQNGVVCLRNSRFQFDMTWTGFDGVTQPVIFVRQSDQTAAGVFQNNPSDITVVVKVTNGCSFNNHYWVWLGGFTNAAWRLEVTDTETGGLEVYTKGLSSTPPQTVKDDASFPCP